MQQGIPPPQAMQHMGGGQIATLEQAVKTDPKNVDAWISLGNAYFDSRQPQKSIDAYAKALELQPNNPNVITDQGVMYREVGLLDQAIANFRKASELDPKHVQSVFNLGVVYTDKGQKDLAAEAYNRVIAMDGNGPHGQQARRALEMLKAGP